MYGLKWFFRNWNIYSLLWLTHSDLQQEPEHRYQSISSEMFVNSWSSPARNQFDWDSSNTWQCWNSGRGWEVALRLLLWSLGLLVAKICESFKNFTQFGDICASKSSIRQNSCRGNVHAASLVGAPACNVAEQLVVLCVAAGVRIRRRKLDLFGLSSLVD